MKLGLQEDTRGMWGLIVSGIARVLGCRVEVSGLRGSKMSA